MIDATVQRYEEYELEAEMERVLPIGDGGGSSFPYEIGETLKVVDGRTLEVNTTDDANQDNTLPITSAGVFTITGNIEALLGTI